MPPTHLIFDLDNTLYPPDLGVVERVNEGINRYLRERLRLAPDAVDILRERYRRDHGTTLHGLMRHHQVEPDDYLAAVHAIDIDDVLAPDPALRAMLTDLPHPKVIFTNASAAHAERVLHRLDVRSCFDAIFSLDRVSYVPKPQPAAFHTVLTALGNAPEDCMFIDDDPRNLATARTLGMQTVLVGPARDDAPHPTVASVLDLTGLLATAPEA